ncbi:tetratricopeptide repeat protein [Oribacterium sp. FC2011]|uniref:tetratricopeptide repeat protein n=1 Tax=Oribacterium sp. FC2011 TaxID=1408311 RepID=UPI0004E19F93|nr:tetratricopeptide repeat protein [Oribacterium sp. FC2011]
MEKKSNPIIIISVVTGILLAALVGIMVYFNLPAQRIKRMLKTANKYIAEENYDEAILTLQKMLEIDPKNEDLYVLLADTYEKSGDIDKEIEFLQEAVNRMPENQKIAEVLSDVNPEVTISEAEGIYKDPIRLTLDAPEDSKIYYIISGIGVSGSNSANDSGTYNKENEYSEPITLDKNGKYSLEYYAVSKNGYEGEHKKGTYVIELDESKCHFTEWVDEADGRHYYEADGKSVTGWKKIGELWYLFDKLGVMLTGFQENDGKTYYLGTDGTMLTGWQEINGNKYYFDDSGAMLKNQWIDDTYYVGTDGAMLVDTKTPDGKKVDKDGKKIDESWKQAYIDVIRGGNYNKFDPLSKTIVYEDINAHVYRGENDEFFWSYAYLNGDDIPELIRAKRGKWYDEVAHDYIYDYSYELFSCFDGIVQSIGLYDDHMGCGHLTYSNGGNLIYADFYSDNHNNYGTYSFKIESTGFVIIHEAEVGYSRLSADPEPEYSFDGISTTHSQFVQMSWKYFNEPNMVKSIDNFEQGNYGDMLPTWDVWESKYTSTEIIDIIENL